MKKPDLSQVKEIAVLKDNKTLQLDPAGYFLLRLHERQLEVGFCNYQDQMLYLFRGLVASDLAKAIAQQLPGLTAAHALYLGRELQRAQDALINNQNYIQD